MDIRRAAARTLVPLAALPVLAASVAAYCDRPGGPALAAELNHPVLLAALAVLALTAAVLLASRSPAVRKAAGVALAGAGVAGG
ncbi:hypothetical protein PL81_20825, partial [Streptomyces sp. RSD-27]